MSAHLLLGMSVSRVAWSWSRRFICQPVDVWSAKDTIHKRDTPLRQAQTRTASHSINLRDPRGKLQMKRPWAPFLLWRCHAGDRWFISHRFSPYLPESHSYPAIHSQQTTNYWSAIDMPVPTEISPLSSFQESDRISMSGESHVKLWLWKSSIWSNCEEDSKG